MFDAGDKCISYVPDDAGNVVPIGQIIFISQFNAVHYISSNDF